MVLNGVQYLHSSRLKCPSKMRKENQNGSNGSMITWDDFGCRSDVVQMSFRMSFRSPLGFKNLTYCSVTDLSTQRQAVAQTTNLMFKSNPEKCSSKSTWEENSSLLGNLSGGRGGSPQLNATTYQRMT